MENKRTENDHPDFGIAAWPTKQYGQFHRGDSYIVLLTTKKDDAAGGEKLLHDIFFWIGSESSQDEYGVAAYKTVGKKCIKVHNSVLFITYYDIVHTNSYNIFAFSHSVKSWMICWEVNLCNIGRSKAKSHVHL